jgi:hypothetical protein
MRFDVRMAGLACRGQGGLGFKGRDISESEVEDHRFNVWDQDLGV